MDFGSIRGAIILAICIIAAVAFIAGAAFAGLIWWMT